MIRPGELRLELKMDVGGGLTSTTSKVWEMLSASYTGNLPRVKELVQECPGLIYAQYNYAPPIHFAVREGHLALVEYLLENGASDPSYLTYPFQEDLCIIAKEREHFEIARLLEQYANDPSSQMYSGDNGRIYFERDEMEKAFEVAVDQNDLGKTEQILKLHPAYALDETYFWGEGILMMPAKENHRQLIDLLVSYGAKVPGILKWTQAYYFEQYDGAAYMMEKGMDPNVMSCHHVTILHDMAQKGNIEKAELLLKYGADIDCVDEEYQSTPLGMAARWGQTEMVTYLLQQGADPNKSGAPWATPLKWGEKRGHVGIEKLLKDVGAK